jgi:hypothetical protein
MPEHDLDPQCRLLACEPNTACLTSDTLEIPEPNPCTNPITEFANIGYLKRENATKWIGGEF